MTDKVHSYVKMKSKSAKCKKWLTKFRTTFWEALNRKVYANEQNQVDRVSSCQIVPNVILKYSVLFTIYNAITDG